VIPAIDVDTIYQVPIAYHQEGFDREVLSYFGLEHRSQHPDLSKWQHIVSRIRNPEGNVTIAVVGKYTELMDSYKSLSEALTHGGIANNVRVNLKWVDAEIFEHENPMPKLDGVDGILVPGGFGERGSQGKVEAVRFAREHKIPYFGICFGLQMAVIEGARNLAGIAGANSTEFGETTQPVVGLMTEWVKGNSVEVRDDRGDLGGTMRLGAYPCVLAADSKAREAYGAPLIQERHRHRYEVNISYRDKLEKAGYRFTGMSPDGELPEIVEYPDHPWFVGVQFHPELKSRPFHPHPLFTAFVKAAVQQSRIV
jgi:CTP synthase